MSSERRHHYRYILEGKVHGSIDCIEEARIVNISKTGALVETSEPLKPAGFHRLRLTGMDAPTRPILARFVRTYKRGGLKRNGRDDGELRYHLALKFLGSAETLQETIDNLLADIRKKDLLLVLPDFSNAAR